MGYTPWLPLLQAFSMRRRRRLSNLPTPRNCLRARWIATETHGWGTNGWSNNSYFGTKVGLFRPNGASCRTL